MFISTGSSTHQPIFCRRIPQQMRAKVLYYLNVDKVLYYLNVDKAAFFQIPCNFFYPLLIALPSQTEFDTNSVLKYTTKKQNN
jgi:hypothetical protein